MVGQTISRYRIVEGGMGIVYKAEDTTLERTVALKFLAQHLLNDEEAKERFLREAKAAAALSHPNICTVYEIAEVDGKTFIAMEFVKGETLEERIAAGPLTLKDALDIGRQVADGLEAAHEENIIHRDIKPANVMVDAKGRAKVMDFGLARLTEASRLTKTNTAMGTVAYMSPEQASSFNDSSSSMVTWSLNRNTLRPFCSAFSASFTANSPGTEIKARFEAGCWVKACSNVLAALPEGRLESLTNHWSMEPSNALAASMDSAWSETTRSLLDALNPSIPS